METIALPKFLNVGATLENGKYRILSVLGHGGFGITYLAEHKTFGKVALKELFLNSGSVHCSRENITQRNVIAHFDGMQFTAFKKRFEDEARTLRSLGDVRGVVKVLDIFEENSTVYFSMEYLDGEKLDEYMARRERLSVNERLALVQTLGKTLGEIHNRGVLHRDVKPENIIITKTGRAMLIDFGIARSHVEESAETHTTFHSPRYSPPEQKIAKSAMGKFSDVYSLGATAYFILTGVPPQTVEERITGEYRSPRYFAPELSADIDAAITRCLEIKQKMRFQTVDEFLAALPVVPDFELEKRTIANRTISATQSNAETLIEGHINNFTKPNTGDEATRIESTPQAQSNAETLIEGHINNFTKPNIGDEATKIEGQEATAIYFDPNATVIEEQKPARPVKDKDKNAGKKRLMAGSIAGGVLLIAGFLVFGRPKIPNNLPATKAAIVLKPDTTTRVHNPTISGGVVAPPPVVQLTPDTLSSEQLEAQKNELINNLTGISWMNNDLIFWFRDAHSFETGKEKGSWEILTFRPGINGATLSLKSSGNRYIFVVHKGRNYALQLIKIGGNAYHGAQFHPISH